jgi:sugar phosphate isomerase/epimerase
MTSRRDFLMGAAALAAAPSALVPSALAAGSIPLGLQLYTVRADLEKDFEGTLKKLHAIGIRRVQASLTQDGKTASQQRKLYDAMGFTWESIHAGGDALRTNLQATIDAAKSVGIRNITCSFALYPAERAAFMAGPSLEDWKRNADTFNACGAACRKAGLTFAYHNHNVEFRKVGDVVPYDYLLAHTDPALVQFEMDIGWIVAGGADPLAYLTRHPDRFYSLHIKDLKNKGIPNTDMKMDSAIIGQGIVDWKKLLPAIHKTKVERAFLEIEEPYDPSALEMVRQSFNYLHGKV